MSSSNTDKPPSLRQLSDKMTNLEDIINNQQYFNGVSGIDNEVKNDILDKVAEKACKMYLCSEYKVTPDDIFKVIDFSISFVENVSEYVPDISKIMLPTTLLHEKYFLIALLVCRIIGDVKKTLTGLTLKQTIQHCLEVRENQILLTKKITDKPVETSIEKEVSGKKRFFPFASTSRKKG
jgi:hypothetical protein